MSRETYDEEIKRLKQEITTIEYESQLLERRLNVIECEIKRASSHNKTSLNKQREELLTLYRETCLEIYIREENISTIESINKGTLQTQRILNNICNRLDVEEEAEEEEDHQVQRIR